MKQRKSFTSFEWAMIILLVLLLIVLILSTFGVIGMAKGIQTLIWGVYFIILGVLVHRFNKRKLAVFIYLIAVLDLIIGVIQLIY